MYDLLNCPMTKMRQHPNVLANTVSSWKISRPNSPTMCPPSLKTLPENAFLNEKCVGLKMNDLIENVSQKREFVNPRKPKNHF